MFGVCRFIVFVWGVSLGRLYCVGRGWVDFGARVLALGWLSGWIWCGGCGFGWAVFSDLADLFWLRI